MSGYSLDLRQRVLAAVARGMPRQEIVVTFALSIGTLKRWLAKERTGSDLRPKSPPGRLPIITPDQHATLEAQLHAHTDVTLAEHAALWNAAHATTLSQWTLGRAIRRLGWTRKKKTLAASERDATKQEQFRARIAERAASDFVIVDEMGSNLNLTPRYACAPRGERAKGSVPRNTPANTTLIAAMSLGGMGAAMVLLATPVYLKKYRCHVIITAQTFCFPMRKIDYV